jgi:hypothetical protein
VLPTRSTPFALDHPTHVLECFDLIDHEHAWANIDVDDISESDEVLFRYKRKSDDHCLHCQCEYMTKKDHVPLERIREHYKFIERIQENILIPVIIPIEKNDSQNEPQKDNYILLGFMTVIYVGIFALFVRQKRKKSSGG